MKWRETLSLSHPLRDVRLQPGAVDPEQRLQEREHAAYAKGLMDGEKALSAQLLQQRAELLELQNGVLASLQQAVPQVVQQSEAALIQLALEVAQKLVADLPISAAMHFQAAPEVSRGGCLVQTRFGIVDARRETKMDLIKQSLTL